MPLPKGPLRRLQRFTIHVPEHQPFPVVVRPFHGGQAIGLGAGDSQGLLAEHGQAALEGGQRDVAVRPGGQHEEAIQLGALEHRRDIGVAPARRDAIAIADGGRERRR